MTKADLFLSFLIIKNPLYGNIYQCLILINFSLIYPEPNNLSVQLYLLDQLLPQLFNGQLCLWLLQQQLGALLPLPLPVHLALHPKLSQAAARPPLFLQPPPPVLICRRHRCRQFGDSPARDHFYRLSTIFLFIRPSPQTFNRLQLAASLSHFASLSFSLGTSPPAFFFSGQLPQLPPAAAAAPHFTQAPPLFPSLRLFYRFADY